MNGEMEFGGKCECSNIKYVLPFLPKEIANCHCTICQSLHQKPYVSFAKYHINEVTFEGQLMAIPSSERANRIYCQKCHSLIYMHYAQSENIWISTDTFMFGTNTIEKYDIYLNKN